MIDNPWFYVLAVPAVLLMGISKTGFGAGSGGFAVPLLALAVPPAQAAGVLLPILCFIDLVGVQAYRGRWQGAAMRVLLPGAVLGIALGTVSFGLLPEAWLKLVIGLIAVLIGLNQWFGFTRRAAPVPASVGRGLFWSALSGFTSMVAHAGGPPLMAYLLSQRLEKTLFVATTVVFFFTVNYLKLVPYALLGQLHGGNLLTSLVLAPLAFLGGRLGVVLHRRVSEKLFYRVIIALLLSTGGKLLWDGASSLGG